MIVNTWSFLPGPGTLLNSVWKVSKPTPTPPMSWWTPIFLTEKTEENGHLERFYGNVCLRKVVQNDLICCPGCLETPSGHSSVVIDRDPPFLTAKMALFRQVMQTKVVSNEYDFYLKSTSPTLGQSGHPAKVQTRHPPSYSTPTAAQLSARQVKVM